MKKTIKLVGDVGGYDNSYNRVLDGVWLESELSGLTSEDEIEFIIHSFGGSVFEGQYMYNLLKKCPAQKIAHVYGSCMSMATIISMACDKVYMCENSMYMVHKASARSYGNEKDIENTLNLLKGIDSIAIETYSKRTKLTKERLISEFMTGYDKWLTPTEALEFGFIDEIKDPVQEVIQSSSYYDYYNDYDVFFQNAKEVEMKERPLILNNFVNKPHTKMEAKTKDLENPQVATENNEIVASLSTQIDNYKSTLINKETEIVNLTERLEALEKEKETIVANAQNEVAKANESETTALEKVNAMEIKLYKQEVENRVNLAVAKISENGKPLNSDKSEKIKVAFLQKHSVIIEDDKESCIDKYTNGVIGDSINAAINHYVIDAGFIAKMQKGINANVNNANGASYSFEQSNNLDEAKAILAKQRELNKQGYATYSAAYTSAMLNEFGNSENEHIAALKAYKR